MDLPVLDAESALKRLLGDRELYGTLAEIFHEDAPQLLREAAAAKDASTIEMAVHRFQGVAASIGATRAASTAAAVVELARTGQWKTARDFVPALLEEVNQIEAALATVE